MRKCDLNLRRAEEQDRWSATKTRKVTLSSAQVSQLLAIFSASAVPTPGNGNGLPKQLNTGRRPVFAVSEPALAVWLRWGELDAAKLECAPFDEQRFRDVLTQIRSLTRARPRHLCRLSRSSAPRQASLLFSRPSCP